MSGTLIIIPADMSKPVQVEPRDRQPELSELHDIVGGYIEAVPHWSHHNGEPCVAFCNEEGKLAVHGREPLPINDRATMMWWNVLGGRPPDGDTLVGNVVLMVNLPDEEEE